MSSALGGKKTALAQAKAFAGGIARVTSATVGFMLFVTMLFLMHEVGADSNRTALACIIVVMAFGYWLGRRHGK